MKRTKASEFNYCVHTDSGYIIYNTLYNTLVRMQEAEYQNYTLQTTSDQTYYDTMLKNGLWVDEELDERGAFLACANACTARIGGQLSLTIATTLRCNARCAYCYESGVAQCDMAEGAEEKIIAFIEKLADKNGVRINWFGGEPLLNTALIDSISSSLHAKGIPYGSYLITNGSLLDGDIVAKLKAWNTTDIQVTLDGTKKIYEYRKNYLNPEEGKYYSILNRIRMVAECGMQIHIRMNIDAENLENIYQLAKELDHVFGAFENVTFYPAFLSGTPSKLSEEEKTQCIKTLLKTVSAPQKLTADTKLHTFPRLNACMNADPRAYSIDVYGNVYTCERQLGCSDKRIGTIYDSNINAIAGSRADGSIRDECSHCVFFPKCFGGCKSDYDNHEVPCSIEKYCIQAYLQLL